MVNLTTRPIDGVTLDEAASILGSSRSTVRRHVLAVRLTAGGFYEHRTLSRAEVEALAAQLYNWRDARQDAESYWVTGRHAAGVLGISRSRLGQLADEDRVPYIRHAMERGCTAEPNSWLWHEHRGAVSKHHDTIHTVLEQCAAAHPYRGQRWMTRYG
jgi:hypothetical protein